MTNVLTLQLEVNCVCNTRALASWNSLVGDAAACLDPNFGIVEMRLNKRLI